MSRVLSGTVAMAHIQGPGGEGSLTSSLADDSLVNWSEASTTQSGDSASELATTLRALAIKTRTVGHSHRSLVPSLTKLTALFKSAGDVDNVKVCLEHRLRIVEQEADKEQADFASLGLSTSVGSSEAVVGPWTKDVSFLASTVDGEYSIVTVIVLMILECSWQHHSQTMANTCTSTRMCRTLSPCCCAQWSSLRSCTVNTGSS